MTDRSLEHNVDPMFVERWSPRAFSSEGISRETLMTLFEAARWAPSSMNEQPWFFLYAIEENDLNLFRSCLVDSNRVWADRCPVLLYLFARKKIAKTGDPNASALFDTGSAWMSLALQARRLDLYAHAMGGIHRDKVYEALNISKEDYQVCCAIALGHMGNAADLPESVQKREHPNSRHAIEDFIHEGGMRG